MAGRAANGAECGAIAGRKRAKAVPGAPGFRHRPPPPDDGYRLPRPLRVRVDNASPEQPGDRRIAAPRRI
jgi:hypothetical protein